MRRLLMRLSALVRRRQFDAELSEELAAHLDEAIADNIASGMSPHDAHRAALLKFGGTMQTIEAYRDREGWPLVEHAVQDLRYAVRRLAARPMLLVTTTLDLGLVCRPFGPLGPACRRLVLHQCLRSVVPAASPSLDRVVGPRS